LWDRAGCGRELRPPDLFFVRCEREDSASLSSGALLRQKGKEKKKKEKQKKNRWAPFRLGPAAADVFPRTRAPSTGGAISRRAASHMLCKHRPRPPKDLGRRWAIATLGQLPRGCSRHFRREGRRAIRRSTRGATSKGTSRPQQRQGAAAAADSAAGGPPVTNFANPRHRPLAFTQNRAHFGPGHVAILLPHRPHQ